MFGFATKAYNCICSVLQSVRSHTSSYFIWCTTNDYEEAIGAFECKLLKTPDDLVIKRYLASAYSGVAKELYRQEIYGGALEDAREAYKLDSSNLPLLRDILMDCGIDLCRDNNYEEGIKLFKKAFKLQPRNPKIQKCLFNALCNYATILYEEGEYKRSIEYLEQARELDFKHSVLLSNIGTAYIAMGAELFVESRHEEAIELCNKAILLDLTNSNAIILMLRVRLAYAKMLQDGGEHTMAQEQYTFVKDFIVI